MSGPPTYPPYQPTQPQQPPDEFYLQQMGAESGPYRYGDLQAMAFGGSLRPDQPVRRRDTPWFPAGQVPGLYSDKEWLVALLLSVGCVEDAAQSTDRAFGSCGTERGCRDESCRCGARTCRVPRQIGHGSAVPGMRYDARLGVHPARQDQ